MFTRHKNGNGAYYINNGLLSGAAEGSIGGGHWYYYCDGLYDAYIWDSSVTPQFDNPVPIRRLIQRTLHRLHQVI